MQRASFQGHCASDVERESGRRTACRAARLWIPGGWAALFCAAWVAVEHVASHAGVGSHQVVWTRYLVHTAILCALVLPRGGVRRLARTSRPALQLGCGLMMLGMPLGQIAAVRTMPLPSVNALFWLVPMVVLALERTLDWRPWMAAVLGWAGAAAAGGWRGTIDGQGALGVLVMGLCFAGYLVGMRRLAAEPAEPKLFYTGVVALAGFSLASAGFRFDAGWEHWLAMACVGALGLVGLYGLEKALESATAGAVALMLFMQPLFGALVEVGTGQRSPDWPLVSAIGSILGGGAVLVLWTRAGGSPLKAETAGN